MDKGRRKILLTENLTPNKEFFDEQLINYKGKEFRTWDPKRSKLAAAVMKGSQNIGFREGDIVLYLGASHGYTPSFVSDIVGGDGFVYALDFAPRVVRDLVFVCEDRKNMTALLADANRPLTYLQWVSPVDVVYQDIAQKNQVDIFVKNIDVYLKKGGYGLLAIKARSVDVTKRPKQIFEQVRKELSEKFEVVAQVVLEPFEKDHCMFIVKK